MEKRFLNYTYKAQDDNKVVDIHIYGVIGVDEAYWDEGTNNIAYTLVSLIKRLDKTYERINVHINSPGGYISDGLAIYNTLKVCKAKIHTYNSGLVASMAGILMLAGTTHYPKTSIHHLHRATSFAFGNINDFEEEIKALKTFEDILITAISEKTGLSKDEITANWFNGKDHYLTAEEADKFGFVDILEENIQVDPPANKSVLEAMNFKDIFELYENQETSEEDKKTIKNKVLQFFNHKVHNQVTNKNSDMKTLKTGVTALLAFFGLTEFSLNKENNIELSLDQALNLNKEIETKDADISAKDAKITELEASIAAKDEEITALNATINGTEVDDDGKPVGGDDSKGDDPNAYKEISDEVSAKLHERNRKDGMY